MSGKKKQLFLRSWFCRIEHEIMLPFVTVGILVVCAFCAISVYNGYTEKLKDRKEYARTTIRGMEADIYYLQGKLSEDEIRQKYNFYHDPAVRILAADGTIITGDEEIPDGNSCTRTVEISWGGVWNTGWIKSHSRTRSWKNRITSLWALWPVS